MSLTPLHRAINVADGGTSREPKERAQAILKVLQERKPSVTLEQVEDVIAKHQKQMEDHMCGLSLCSMLVNELMS